MIVDALGTRFLATVDWMRQGTQASVQLPTLRYTPAVFALLKNKNWIKNGQTTPAH
jgi:hypothetical protein